MSYLKRALALVLALCFVLVIASCSKNPATGGDATTAATTTAAQGDANVETTVAGGDETVATGATTTKGTVVTTKMPTVATVTDIEGYSTIGNEIKRTTDKNGNASAAFIKSLKGYTLKIFDPWTGAAAGTTLYQDAAFVETEVEKEFGVEIYQTGNWEGYAETVFANITSGRPDADIYKVQDFNYATYLSKKYMANLTKAMTTSGVDMKEPWYSQDARKFFNVNNGQYAWLGSNSAQTFYLYYNKDMIKKAGLTDPADLVAKKQWTWDKLKTYSEKLTTASVMGLSCGTTVTDFLASMVISSGSSLVVVDNGVPKSNIKSAVVKNCLQTLATWTKNDAVFNIMKGQEMWQEAPNKFAKGELAMILGGTVDKSYRNYKSTFKMGVVPFPTPKAGQDYVTQRKLQWIDFIPAPKATSAAKILFIRNEMYRVSYRLWDREFQINNQDMFPVGSKDLTNFSNIAFDRAGFKSAINVTSLTEKSGATASTDWTVYEVVNGTRTPQAAIDTYSSVIDQEYASTWKGLKITGK
ncbi:MAG: extracellular solute-binding protein [Clostridia bacterium]|nr:extracellular solute-binding protein [Clostridia bacterium]